MIRVIVFLLVAFTVTSAQAASCPTIKSSDSYRELSIILKCLEDRIQELETQNAALSNSKTSTQTATPSDNVWQPGKCLPYAKDQAFKTTITIEEAPEGLVLCWKDGTAMAKVFKFEFNGLALTDPANVPAKPRNGRFTPVTNACAYNVGCIVRLEDATLNFRPEMLVAAKGRKLARLHIESRPN